MQKRPVFVSMGGMAPNPTDAGISNSTLVDQRGITLPYAYQLAYMQRPEH